MTPEGEYYCGFQETLDPFSNWDTIATSVTTPEIMEWIIQQGGKEFKECLQQSGHLKRKRIE